MDKIDKMDKIIKIYNPELYPTLLNDLKVLHLHKIEETAPKLVQNLECLEIAKNLTCSCCKITFDDVLSQRRHYKSDWHRYNLKLNLKKVKPINEDEFEKIAATDDVSSISGSDTDSDDDSDRTVNVLYKGKVYLKSSATGRIFGIYRSLLHEKKSVPANEECLIQLVKQTPRKLYWTVLMIGGGHFAGAVYEGANILVHKTFHLYTCRAKQGGAQYKEGNARSAGASLRRYNELQLNQHIAELLQNWSQYIEKSHLIFYRAAGPYNRTALFGGKAPTLKKTDARLRSIPFCTKRPTFTELKRVHDLLTNVEIYDSIDELKTRFHFEKPPETTKPGRGRGESPQKNKNINRAKSRESKETNREVPGLVDDLIGEQSDSSVNETDLELTTQDEIISFEGLQEADMTQKPQQRRRRRAQKPKPTEIKTEKTETKLTDEELAERAARKQAQKKAKREREKEKKKENNLKRQEEEERTRYLKLSDREKRALAAERRILAQTSQVLVRCFLCAEDISGRVPFEYSGNRFCSMSCLKAHRLQNPVILS